MTEDDDDKQIPELRGMAKAVELLFWDVVGENFSEIVDWAGLHVHLTTVPLDDKEPSIFVDIEDLNWSEVNDAVEVIELLRKRFAPSAYDPEDAVLLRKFHEQVGELLAKFEPAR